MRDGGALPFTCIAKASAASVKVEELAAGESRRVKL